MFHVKQWGVVQERRAGIDAHSPIPFPSGGGCRPQGRPKRENVAGPRCGNDSSRGICERFYRLQAVRFSLFRHPPRGGSADATFPRWGKEMAATDSPDVAAHLRFCCAARRISAPYMG